MSAPARLAATLRDLLGPGAGVGVTDPKAPGGDLWPEEAPAIARAVPRRRLEFTAGRVAARRAMAELGIAPQPVLQAPDRAPIWPEGLVGSIAHCDTVCIAAVARADRVRAIGIDIEPATPLAADLENVICTPAERAWLDTQPTDQRGMLIKLIFSAKESAYKAQYILTGELIGFETVEVKLDLVANYFAIGSGATATAIFFVDQIVGRFILDREYVLSTCRLAAS